MQKNNSTQYGFYSKILNKPFDSLEELKNAEENFLKKKETKEKLAKERKTDAEQVEQAFKDLNSAKKTYAENVSKIEDEYLQKLTELRKNFNEKIRENNIVLKEVENNYKDRLKTFIEKHPEGYHMTLRDGDTVLDVSKSVEKDSQGFEVSEFFDSWKQFFDKLISTSFL